MNQVSVREDVGSSTLPHAPRKAIAYLLNIKIARIMEEKKANVFETLHAINVNEHTEKKGQLTYLSWAWAWAEVKKHYPQASYTIYENKDGLNYHTDGRTCWVKTGVTIEGIEHIEYLPVMDYQNRSIALDKVTSFDVNKAIQRSLTKAAARHGLGLYIYAGEDLPEEQQGGQKGEKAYQKDSLTIACDEAKGAKTISELQAIYHKYELMFKKNSTFIGVINQQKSKLLNVA